MISSQMIQSVSPYVSSSHPYITYNQYADKVSKVHTLLQKQGRICTCKHTHASCTLSGFDADSISRTSKLTLTPFNSKKIKRIKANEYLLGCPVCDNTYTNPTKMTNVYIEVAGIVHNHKYKYVECTDPHNQTLTFKCYKHGTQKMHSLKTHLLPTAESGWVNGCSACYSKELKYRYTSANPTTHLYLVKLTANPGFEDSSGKREEFYKIGVAKNGARGRFETWSAYRVDVLLELHISSVRALEVEEVVLTTIRNKRLSYVPTRAYERLSPKTLLGGAGSECFKTTDITPIIKQINMLVMGRSSTC